MTRDLGNSRWGVQAREFLTQQRASSCHCSPCPGRGNDGHGMTHCAECCFGSGVVADIDCPIHGPEALGAGDTRDAPHVYVEPPMSSPHGFCVECSLAEDDERASHVPAEALGAGEVSDDVEPLQKCLRCLEMCEPGFACVSAESTCARPCRPVAPGGVLSVGGEVSQ